MMVEAEGICLDYCRQKVTQDSSELSPQLSKCELTEVDSQHPRNSGAAPQDLGGAWFLVQLAGYSPTQSGSMRCSKRV